MENKEDNIGDKGERTDKKDKQPEKITLFVNKEDLNCKACNEFMRIPKVLPCAHRLCESCLYRMYMIVINKQGSGMKCPYCRTPISIECPTDTFLINLLENITLERPCKMIIENSKYDKHIKSCHTCLLHEFENAKKFDIRNKPKRSSTTSSNAVARNSPPFNNTSSLNDVSFELLSSIFPGLTSGYINNP